jgi:YHS domain-containing protein
MSRTPDDLSEFGRKLREKVAALDAQPQWPQEEFDRHMQAIMPRLIRFNEVVDHLITQVVGPRLGEFVKHFPQARVSRTDRPNRCSCSLGYTDRFPVNVKIEFAFDHDTQIEHLTIAHTLDILPTFFKYEQRAQLWLALEGIDDATVAAWVEERLLGFVDAYACVDRGPGEQEFDRVTDPVCGMQFARSNATARADYRGHDYFFCSTDCRDQFSLQPERFIRFELE